ncbi:MAG: hypothetical protein KBS60_01375 [Phascolarctobacterium sp.]|nr:hypothetical protein [Candidatus Phascolarctobacterium caballi]
MRFVDNPIIIQIFAIIGGGAVIFCLGTIVTIILKEFIKNARQEKDMELIEDINRLLDENEELREQVRRWAEKAREAVNKSGIRLGEIEGVQNDKVCCKN